MEAAAYGLGNWINSSRRVRDWSPRQMFQRLEDLLLLSDAEVIVCDRAGSQSNVRMCFNVQKSSCSLTSRKKRHEISKSDKSRRTEDGRGSQ
ncbi:hypothetical protein GBF38_016821 [Nibea albiflora]|uniref:Uncharacterized protein n=1 Tax=Nibea albiflora TaxID=240163 RepID=A0ACB7EEA6_NIBAL|nr:hypothetical protein GBF38_016821 [Nibea albiflora]